MCLIKACDSGFQNAIIRMLMICMFKPIYFSKDLFSVTLEQEKRIMIFKTYDMRLHIQIIYCQLIGCRSVATNLNY